MSDEPGFEPRKIGRFRIACEQHDWDVAEDWFGDNYRVKAWRDDGEERILMIWRDRYFSGEESYYELLNVRRKAISNQAEAMRFVQAEPDYTFARDEDGRKAMLKNVYDFSDVTDKEVCAQLAGRKLTWINSYTREHEVGIVPQRGRWTKIGYGQEGLTRFITFADAGGLGFRSVNLEKIIKIK